MPLYRAGGCGCGCGSIVPNGGTRKTNYNDDDDGGADGVMAASPSYYMFTGGLRSVCVYVCPLFVVNEKVK